MASVHRFHNLVALSTSGGATVYLPAPDALALAAALQVAAKSVRAEAFGESSVRSVQVADFAHSHDGHNVADAIKAGRIRVRETSPGSWRAYTRAPGKRWKPVRSPAGPIAYTSPEHAYRAACYSEGLGE